MSKIRRTKWKCYVCGKAMRVVPRDYKSIYPVPHEGYGIFESALACSDCAPGEEKLQIEKGLMI